MVREHPACDCHWYASILLAIIDAEGRFLRPLLPDHAGGGRHLGQVAVLPDIGFHLGKKPTDSHSVLAWLIPNEGVYVSVCLVCNTNDTNIFDDKQSVADF